MLSTKFNPDINELLTQISQLYPTLGRKAPPTPQSISMKGDVVEVALALCREAGHSIAKPKVIADMSSTISLYSSSKRRSNF